MSKDNLMIFWFWFTGLSFTLVVTGLVFWLFWWPLRLFLNSLIPVHATFAWIGKLAIILFVGWLGGIGIPIVILGVGFMIIFSILSQIQ